MPALFAIAVFIALFFLHLFFIKFAWALVVVPIFHVAELSWLQAWALAFLLSLVRSTLSYTRKE